MCLAVPARVVECLEGDRALIDLEGVRMDISVELLDDVHPGDYVIVHVGYAIGKLDEQEALATLKAMAAMAQTDAASTAPSGPREGVLP
jgi:hydrogenase expression/formation protein HypC